MVTDFVVVRVSKTNAAKDNFFERGVDECCNSDESRCDLMVVLPVPDSPLLTCQRYVLMAFSRTTELNRRVQLSPSPASITYRKTVA